MENEMFNEKVQLTLRGQIKKIYYFSVQTCDETVSLYIAFITAKVF